MADVNAKKRKKKSSKKEHVPSKEELEQQEWARLSPEEQLRKCCGEGLFEKLEELLEAGATLPSAKRNTDSVLHLAARGGSAPMIDFLLDRKFSATHKNGNGDTPVHTGCFWGHAGVVERFIARGVNTTAKNKSGQTPLDVAKKRFKDSVIKLFAGELDLSNKGLQELDKALWQDAPFDPALARTIDLRGNCLHYLPVYLAELPLLEDVLFSENPMTLMPADITANVPWARVKSFLLDQQKRIPSFQRCHKLVFVGPKGGGKSKLLQALKSGRNSTDTDDYYSTKGMEEHIDVRFTSSGWLSRTWQSTSAFTVWEMGGSPSLKPIYSPFMHTQSIFVLAFDIRLSGVGAYEDLEYWMNLIHATRRTGEAPRILLVATHFDRTSFNAKEAEEFMEKIRTRFSEKPFFYGESMVDVVFVSSRNGHGILELKQQLDSMVEGNAELRANISWVRLLDFIRRQTSQTFASLEEIRTWARLANVPREEFGPLMSYFSRAGKLLGITKDLFVIRPIKLAEAIKSISYDRRAAWQSFPNCGRVHEWRTRMGQILTPSSSFAATTRLKWIEVLQYLGICVVDDKAGELLVPWFFSPQKAAGHWMCSPPEGHVELERVYRSHFIPAILISRIVASLMQLAKSRPDSLSVIAVWRQGVLLREVSLSPEGEREVSILNFEYSRFLRSDVEGAREENHRQMLLLQYQLPSERLKRAQKAFKAGGRKIKTLTSQLLLFEALRRIDQLLFWSFPQLHHQLLQLIPCPKCDETLAKVGYFDVPELEAIGERKPTATVTCRACLPSSATKKERTEQAQPIALLAPDAVCSGMKRDTYPVMMEIPKAAPSND